MSISAKEARERSSRTDFRINGKTYEDLLESQDRSIEYAVNEGRTYCDFSIHDTVYSNMWEDQMKEHYKALGYKFRPTGYLGGIWQRTLEIYW